MAKFTLFVASSFIASSAFANEPGLDRVMKAWASSKTIAEVTDSLVEDTTYDWQTWVSENLKPNAAITLKVENPRSNVWLVRDGKHIQIIDATELKKGILRIGDQAFDPSMMGSRDELKKALLRLDSKPTARHFLFGSNAWAQTPKSPQLKALDYSVLQQGWSNEMCERTTRQIQECEKHRDPTKELSPERAKKDKVTVGGNINQVLGLFAPSVVEKLSIPRCLSLQSQGKRGVKLACRIQLDSVKPSPPSNFKVEDSKPKVYKLPSGVLN